MQPDISEFSYGYALTECLVAAAGYKIRAAPVFPSLIDEGKAGGGYDVHIPFAGFPLFLQFKLSHKMVRATAEEVKLGVLTKPFYRFHLRPTRHSQQHPMLLDLENAGELVFYAAPIFHQCSELNAAYLARRVVEQSIFVRPSQIGHLPDDKDHHISFKRAGPAFLCSSNPEMIREAQDHSRDFIDEILAVRTRQGKAEPTKQSFEVLAEKIQSIVESRHPMLRTKNGSRLDAIRSRGPISRIAYLAHTYLGCGVVWIAPE